MTVHYAVVLAPSPDDAAAVRAAQDGNHAALRALFERHQRAVFGYCLVAARRDRDRALDLTQETFSRVFRALDTIAEPERFRSWLFRIAANVCRTSALQEERRDRVLQALQLEQAADGEGEPPVEVAQREERIATVRRVLAHIADERLREIVQLKYGEPEHTTREIAEKLSVPHGTVTVKLMRFRAAIRRELCHALASEGTRRACENTSSRNLRLQSNRPRPGQSDRGDDESSTALLGGKPWRRSSMQPR
jgi:RNA polymerase sigma-70 factor, ECF subfamily